MNIFYIIGVVVVVLFICEASWAYAKCQQQTL